MNLSCKPILTFFLSSIRWFWNFPLTSSLSFSLLSSNDNNFKRGKAGGSLGVDRPKTNYGRMTCTIIYGCWLSLWYPYRPTVLFFHIYAFVLANSTRATRANELDDWTGDEVYGSNNRLLSLCDTECDGSDKFSSWSVLCIPLRKIASILRRIIISLLMIVNKQIFSTFRNT